MEVFGIGPFELLLVAAIAFIVLGPERIPEVARSAGKAIRQIRESLQQLTTESGEKINIADDLAALRREVLGLQKDLTRVTKDILLPSDQSPAPRNPASTSTRSTPESTPPSETDIIDMGAPPQP